MDIALFDIIDKISFRENLSVCLFEVETGEVIYINKNFINFWKLETFEQYIENKKFTIDNLLTIISERMNEPEHILNLFKNKNNIPESYTEEIYLKNGEIVNVLLFKIENMDVYKIYYCLYFKEMYYKDFNKNLGEEFQKGNNSIFKQDQRKIFYEIFLKLKAFSHNEIALVNLNRIALFIKNISNISSNLTIDSENSKINTTENYYIPASKRIIMLCNEYKEITKPVINHLLTLLEIAEPKFRNQEILSKIRTKKLNLKYSSDSLENICGLTLSIDHLNDQMYYFNRKKEEILFAVNQIKILIKSIKLIIKNNYFINIEKSLINLTSKLSSKYERLKINLNVKNKFLSGFVSDEEFRDILEIIIVNAYEAMVKNKVEEKCVIISAYSFDKNSYIEIENKGTFISDDIKKKMFKENISSKPEHKGFGLLYSYSCLENYGGNIRLDEEYKEGTKFILKLINY